MASENNNNNNNNNNNDNSSSILDKVRGNFIQLSEFVTNDTVKGYITDSREKFNSQINKFSDIQTPKFQSMLQDNFKTPANNISIDMNNNNEYISKIARHNPQVVVGFVTTVVAIPSLFMSRKLGAKFFFVSTAGACLLSTCGVTLMNYKWQNDKK